MDQSAQGRCKTKESVQSLDLDESLRPADVKQPRLGSYMHVLGSVRKFMSSIRNQPTRADNQLHLVLTSSHSRFASSITIAVGPTRVEMWCVAGGVARSFAGGANSRVEPLHVPPGA